MTRNDLDELEARFAVKLPIDYREFLLAYPADLPAVIRGYELLDHPAMIAIENANVRDGLFWGIEWPSHYFVVGADGAGNVFCIETTKHTPPVLFFDHDDRTFRQEAPSLVEWLPHLKELHS
jgi:hypothetical protein